MFCVSYVFFFPRVLYRMIILWLTASAVPFTSHALSPLPFVDDGWNRSVGSCAPPFQLFVFIGGVVSTSGVVSSMVGLRGKRFSVVSFQRHVSWSGLREHMCWGGCLCHVLRFLYFLFLFSVCFV